MFKIILVDDNKTFLEGFNNIVDWAKHGFEVVGLFHDGSDAIEYTKNNYIDAVITDIRMPDVSGIGLAKHLHETYPDIKTVFFSAYCDFESAAAAIKYDVVGYISKPISLEQINEALDKLFEKLTERTKDDIGELVDSEIIAAREDLFCHWLTSDKMHSDFLKEDLAKVNILYQAVHLQCALGIFEIGGIDERFNSKWKHDKKNFYEAVSKAVCVDAYSYYTVRLSFTDDRLAVLYIAKRDNSLSRKRVVVAAEDLREIFGLQINKTEFISYDSMSDFKAAFKKPKTNLLKALKKSVAKRKDIGLLVKVEDYVNEHYAETIDMETVANQCYFHPKRFSQVFKAMKGEKFLDYLNKVRIQKARELLMQGVDIEEVYSKVGYDSKRYFYKLFSEYTGDTPAHYRKKMSEARK